MLERSKSIRDQCGKLELDNAIDQIGIEIRCNRQLTVPVNHPISLDSLRYKCNFFTFRCKSYNNPAMI